MIEVIYESAHVLVEFKSDSSAFTIADGLVQVCFLFMRNYRIITNLLRSYMLGTFSGSSL